MLLGAMHGEGCVAHMEIRSALQRVWKPGLSQDFGGLSPPCIFTNNTIYLLVLGKPSSFLLGTKILSRGDLGQREPSQRGKKAKKGQKGSPALTWAPLLTEGLF